MLTIEQKHNTQSTESFDDSQFSKLPITINRREDPAFVRKQFNNAFIDEIEYGTIYTEIQDVVDLLGYGAYLETQGFTFNYFEGEQKQFLIGARSQRILFWTTQKWAEGSVITLSPSAQEIRYNPRISQWWTIYLTDFTDMDYTKQTDKN